MEANGEFFFSLSSSLRRRIPDAPLENAIFSGNQREESEQTRRSRGHITRLSPFLYSLFYSLVYIRVGIRMHYRQPMVPAFS